MFAQQMFDTHNSLPAEYVFIEQEKEGFGCEENEFMFEFPQNEGIQHFPSFHDMSHEELVMKHFSAQEGELSQAFSQGLTTPEIISEFTLNQHTPDDVGIEEENQLVEAKADDVNVQSERPSSFSGLGQQATHSCARNLDAQVDSLLCEVDANHTAKVKTITKSDPDQNNFKDEKEAVKRFGRRED